MEQHHFDIILEQLTMIEGNTRKEDKSSLSSTVCKTSTDSIYRFRRIFFAKLETKTDWERCELKRLFEESMTEVIEKENILTNECPF